MQRRVDGRDISKKTINVSIAKLQVEMAKQWRYIDEGWEGLQKRMATLGVRPPHGHEMIVQLNIGGSHADVPLSVFSQASDPLGSPLSTLLVGVWDRSLPRDASGRLFIDESPERVKEVFEAASQEFRRMAESVISDSAPFCGSTHASLPREEISHLNAPSLVGESTVLGPGDHDSLSRLLESGCPQRPRELKLLYRASRDGFEPQSFHSNCDDVVPTVTLVRVSIPANRSGNNHSSSKQRSSYGSVGGYSNDPYTRANGSQHNYSPSEPCSSDGIVGGFSNVSWAAEEHPYKRSADAFIFMLRDGSGKSERSHSHAAKWGIREVWHTDNRNRAINCKNIQGPMFGVNDLHVELTTTSKIPILSCGAGNGNIYDVPSRSSIAFQSLSGGNIMDLEVYQVVGSVSTETQRQPMPSAIIDDLINTSAGKTSIDPLRASVTECMRCEKSMLQAAKDELALANARIKAAARALENVYGPRVMAGEEDAVVELTVRGTFMTTLQSTLQACPVSALAAMFNEKRWPVNDRTVDTQGRRILDCDPIHVGKVLEVLRLTKRVAWAREREVDAGTKTSNGAHSASVVVNSHERELFEELVNMYFPGCESSIMDLVSFRDG